MLRRGLLLHGLGSYTGWGKNQEGAYGTKVGLCHAIEGCFSVEKPVRLQMEKVQPAQDANLQGYHPGEPAIRCDA